MKETAVNLEVRYDDQIFDLRVPKQVGLARVQELLAPIMAEQKVQLPVDWELVLISKPLVVQEDVPLANYPLADGDCFEVRPKGA